MHVSPTRPGERQSSGSRYSGRWRGTFEAAALLSATILVGVSSGYSQLLHHEDKPREAAEFKYAGGTEKLPDGCTGRLEVTPDRLDFACFQYDITVPYAAIRIMEYRPNVSRRVRKLKPKWKVRPIGGGGKVNRYFTVAFTQGGKTHVMVLEVLPDAMRPYLAEIDLKAGRRVEVMGYEDYENNE